MHHRYYDCGPGAHFGRWGRRHGFGGWGGFGRGWGGGPGGFGLGRLFRDGGLRLITLALLDEAPRHGYDIIKALEERSGGSYSPSPGVVYPTLTFLEEAGYATASAEGNKKVYTITEAGRAYLNENRETVDAMLDGLQRFGKKMASAREWFEWTEGPGGSGSSEATGAAADLDKARRRLRALIVAAVEGSEEDQRRVTEALRRAADEILGKTGGSA